MPAVSFKPKLLEKVVDKTKTQTRRACLPGQIVDAYANGIIARILSAKHITQFAVGHTYAVKPGRSAPAVLWSPTYGMVTDYRAMFQQVNYNPAPAGWSLQQIRHCLVQDTDLTEVRLKVLELRLVDARDISLDDTHAEGFDAPPDFLEVWIGMHDKGIWLSKMDYPMREMNIGDWYMHSTEHGNKWTKDSADEAFIWQVIQARPAEFYRCNAITFELT